MADAWTIVASTPEAPKKKKAKGGWEIVESVPETISTLVTAPSMSAVRPEAPAAAPMEPVSALASAVTSPSELQMTPGQTMSRIQQALVGEFMKSRPTEIGAPPVPVLRQAPPPELPGQEIGPADADITQFMRRLKERTGVAGAGVSSLGEILQTAALPYTIPRGILGTALDEPYRAIHDLGPGEGGVTPGKVAEFGLDLTTMLGAGPVSLVGKAKAATSARALSSEAVNSILSDVLQAAHQGKLSNVALTSIKMLREYGVSKGDLQSKVLPILDRAERISSRVVMQTPEAQAVLGELTKAASRGEAGSVALSTMERLHELGVSSKDIAAKIAPFLDKDAMVLGAVGKGKIKLSPQLEAAVESVLGHVSIGEKTGIRIPRPTELYADLVDMMNPVKKLLDKTVPAEELVNRLNPYEALRLLPGSWGKVDSFLSYQPLNMNTLKFEGKALGSIIRPFKGDLDKFRAYLAARQALSLEADGIKTGFNMKAAKDTVKSLKPVFGKPAKEVTEYANRSLKTLLDSGVISGNTYRAIVKMHPEYAPMYRIAPDLDLVFSSTAEKAMRAAKKTLEPSNPLNKIFGSNRTVIDPLEGLIKNTYLYIRAADKNLAIGELIKWSKEFPELGKYIRPVAKTETKLAVDTAKAALKKGWTQDALRSLKPDGFMPFPNTIAHYDKGIRTLYEVPPEIAAAIKGLDRTEINMLWRLLAKPAQLLRAGATLSPEFIARNPFRDQMTAYVFSKYGYVPGVDWVRGISHVLARGTAGDELYWKWKAAGGEHSMLVSLDRVALQKDLQRTLQGIGGLEAGSFNFRDIVNPIEGLRLLSILGEKGTRLGEFAKATKRLGSTKEALQKAAFASREVSLDFARSGAYGKAMNMLTAFWNAQVQGVDKMVRSAAEQPGLFALRVGSSITLPSLLIVARNMTDGRWAEIPAYQKDLFWIFFTGHVSKEDWKKMTAQEKAAYSAEHPIIRLPKPFEIGVLFGSAPERVFEFMMEEQEKKDPTALEDWLKTAVDMAAPGAIPTAALPIWELARNQSSFTGAKILPEGQKGMLPAWQSRADTPEFLKALSKSLAQIVGEERTFSPVYANHLIRSWSGGLGYYATTLTDGLLGKAGVLPDIEKIRPEMPVRETIPLVRGFLVKFPTTAAPMIEHFFQEYKKNEDKSKTTKELAQRGVGGYTNVGAVGEATAIRQVYTAITQALNAASDIGVNPVIEPKTKKQLIDTIIFSTAIMAKAGLDQMQVVAPLTEKVIYREEPGAEQWKIKESADEWTIKE